MGYLLFFSIAAVLAAVVIFLMWSYRKKLSEKAAASQERYAQLFSATQSVAGLPGQGIPAVAAATALRPAGPSGYGGKERLLSKPETLLFYLLKTGLPGHEIFVQVNLAAVVDTPSALQDYERELQQRRLMQHSLDFVVCDKTTKIIAAVEFESDTAGAAFKAACLESAGIRHVRVKSAAFPRREDIPFLVLGTRLQPGA